ncbi:hypothetical protein GCM10009549_48970 [Streptomyces thermoalcalitolerans]|uniref:Uncharacterized protein n=1 Tax=Streptomyces thermoalcalitolerans TaxID=65605 RepID=A0ABP3ZXH3_9ACTN
MLSAVLTRGPEVWAAAPEKAHEVKKILTTLQDLSPYIQSEAEEFLRSLPDGLWQGPNDTSTTRLQA